MKIARDTQYTKDLSRELVENIYYSIRNSEIKIPEENPDDSINGKPSYSKKFKRLCFGFTKPSVGLLFNSGSLEFNFLHRFSNTLVNDFRTNSSCFLEFIVCSERLAERHSKIQKGNLCRNLLLQRRRLCMQPRHFHGDLGSDNRCSFRRYGLFHSHHRV